MGTLSKKNLYVKKQKKEKKDYKPKLNRNTWLKIIIINREKVGITQFGVDSIESHIHEKLMMDQTKD